MDTISAGFPTLWTAFKSAPPSWSFADYWARWKTAGFDTHLGVRTIAQNTIQYNTAPQLNLPGTLTLLEGQTYDNAVQLSALITDAETDFARLTITLNYSDSRCGVSLDADKNLDFALQLGWRGTCTISINVGDSLATTSGSFTVYVEPIRGRSYLPNIQRADSGLAGPTYVPPGGYPGPNTELLAPVTDGLLMPPPSDGYPGPHTP